ncbi:MAG: PAS domain-containing protein [Cytophagaceae bacterium]|nr:PAS domain-containing protein [Cytophagaceae bacterium]
MSNDNAQSFNEELLSSNEEMQSTNEELQSVNEELQTVNNEHHLKIKELAEVNDDLNNYFRSTINGQVFIDRNLIIRKFTPAATKQINLKESDIGRPLSDISTNIKLSNLIDEVKKVISNFLVNEQEIETNDNRWYKMTIIPYIKQQDNSADGVIITFNDITDLKKAQETLIKINADHDTFIYSASHDLRAPINNIVLLSDTLNFLIPNDQKLKDITSLIGQSAKILADTVSDLSNITKIKDDITGHADNVNLKALIEEIRITIQDLIDKSNAKIETKLPSAEAEGFGMG